MKRFLNPDRQKWPELTKRATALDNDLENRVGDILQKVKKEGDKALFELTKEFDGVSLDRLLLDPEDIAEMASQVNDDVKQAIEIAISNISGFHSAQKQDPLVKETMPGVKCILKSLPIEKIGLYVPGGSAPLFSTVLMLGVPAKLAGCSDVMLFTPPAKCGGIPPAIAYSALRLGITRIATIGGAQAIAAMAFGTESIVKRDKIFGPGNSYVTTAKELVSSYVAIDMPAGPSELMVIADESCDPEFVAADLLSQAEHGADSQVFLLSNSIEVLEMVTEFTERLILDLPRKMQAQGAMSNSRAIFFDDLSIAFDFANIYAPEHLIICTKDAWERTGDVKAAGSVFIGNYSPESAGDYASGTNHTLPTGGWARSYGGISLDSFMHKITFQELTKGGLLSLSKTICTMAREESLNAHENAIRIRVDKIESKMNN